VTGERFPAVPGMTGLFNWAADHGYAIFIITGRPEAQRAATEANLTKVGYTKVGYKVPADQNVFLKNAASPAAYLSCATTDTTDQYKSQTRAHIESLGYDIVANFGDQYSDLSYG
jgi:predicted secreted acid phosphatase